MPVSARLVRHSGLLAMLALGTALCPGQSVAAGRAPDPRQAEACLAELGEALRAGPLDAAHYQRFFAPPPGPLGDSPAGRRLDRERLATLLSPTGAIGSVLAGNTKVEAVHLGPDYVRVVLDTSPFLSFVLVRDEGQVRILRWETTACGDCREPTRFVTDLIARAREGGRPPLVPALDLLLPRASGELEEGSPQWRMALTTRNLGAGYLRWLLADAEVLGQEMDGVRVSVRDRVETWPVVYRNEGWAIDYDRLPPESLLRLDPADQAAWRGDGHARAMSVGWWIPEHRTLPCGGVLLAESAVGVAWQAVQQRWLVAVQRPDGLVAGLFGVDDDGSVSARTPLPAWPDQTPRPVRQWARSWTVALSPVGDRLLVAAAGRWWMVDLASGASVLGPRGLLGEVRVAAWSLDGSAVVLGDELGNLAVLDPATAQLREVRYASPGEDGHRPPAAGLAFAPGGGSLLVAGGNGRLQAYGVPGLIPLDRAEEVCCGEATALAIQPGRGLALVACGGGCSPAGVTSVSLYGVDPPEQYGDAALSDAGGLLSLSPDGAWAILAAAGPGANAALCRADNLAPVATFSAVPLLDAAWDGDGRNFLALREDGSAVRWSVAGIIESAGDP